MPPVNPLPLLLALLLQACTGACQAPTFLSHIRHLRSYHIYLRIPLMPSLAYTTLYQTQDSKLYHCCTSQPYSSQLYIHIVAVRHGS